MRKIISFNDKWKFTKDSDPAKARWEEVSLPHTWNHMDGMDGRGAAGFSSTEKRPAATREAIPPL